MKNREEKKSKENKMAEASWEELELLLADENRADNKLKGYKMKQKGKKGEEGLEEEKIPAADDDDSPSMVCILHKVHM